MPYHHQGIIKEARTKSTNYIINADPPTPAFKRTTHLGIVFVRHLFELNDSVVGGCEVIRGKV